MHIPKTSVAGKLNVADFIFQIRYADAEVVQFVGIFVSQFVNQCALFYRSAIHVSHGFGDHFSGFVTGDIAISFEIFAVNALNDAGVSQFYDGFVGPAVRRYVYERIGGKGVRCAYGHRCC